MKNCKGKSRTSAASETTSLVKLLLIIFCALQLNVSFGTEHKLTPKTLIVIDVKTKGGSSKAITIAKILEINHGISAAELVSKDVLVNLDESILTQLDTIAYEKQAVIYVTTPLLAADVRKKFPLLPIIVSGVIDTRTPGWDAFLSRSDSNITGVLYQQTPMSKRVSHLARVCRDLRSIAYVTTRHALNIKEFNAFIENEKSALASLGLKLSVIVIDSVQDLRRAISEIQRTKIDALDIVMSTFVSDNLNVVLREVSALNLPYVFSQREAVTRGAAFAIYASVDQRHEKVSRIVAGLLKGNDISNYPVEVRIEVDLAIRYSSFKKFRQCDADRAFQIATVRLP